MKEIYENGKEFPFLKFISYLWGTIVCSTEWINFSISGFVYNLLDPHSPILRPEVSAINSQADDSAEPTCNFLPSF